MRCLGESYLVKGMGDAQAPEIARFFDECCLLFGLPGQNRSSMEEDIRTGLEFFERVCVNIMEENSAPIKPDPAVIAVFAEEILPRYEQNPRVDILMNNTDFEWEVCALTNEIVLSCTLILPLLRRSDFSSASLEKPVSICGPPSPRSAPISKR